ncbi:sterol desaturase family protein [Ruegeria pomeroyi]|uniref:Sterol desaturase family protein n=1 Tax=Ruegeria alba TaxID=2916756 RepID=A0ABS9NWD6_9RHOB|nr:sterol desaturase family protein [Ruegeria alba]MCE8513219.1 sterol desaturase family protein [Ruegeria pomeroyi]MCE8522127.1 sterol desaturase family protein [Ruegeria pomeroyi]MCE8529823.1 sterol desaturase family protein [Ruegeria pomeroyi]MCG6558518.1 sterol desaturase family protein [Ruegeria alba]
MSDTQLKGWNHVPDVPLKVSPIFSWPPNPTEIAGWFWSSWFLITEKLIIVGIAFASYLWFQPPLEESRTFAFGWVAQMYARNLLLALIIGGALHLWFYTFSAQGLKLKFDPRPLMVNGRQFTLGGQVRDNMFWTLGTGVLIWTGYEVVLIWALSNGYMPLISWAAHPVWFVAIFFLIPIWESFYFYVIHRTIHIPFLYKHVHYLHHRNINVGPWSGMSQHPIEQMIFLGSVFVHLLIGAHPVHILFHLQYYFLTAMTTHTGFQGLLIKDKNRLALGTFHHQMHHRYFECNYGSLEIPLDKWFGTFHNGTVEANEKMQERRKRIMGK